MLVGPGGYCVYVSMPDAGAVIRPWNDNGAMVKYGGIVGIDV